MVVSFLGLSIDAIAAYCTVFLALAGLIAWLKKQADKRGITSKVARWVKTNWTYCRFGFRWYAFLVLDLTTNHATAIITKYPVFFHGSAVQYGGVTYDSGVRVA